MASIKTRVRVLRAEREWSQAKLAAVVGVTRQTVNSIENGRYHPNLCLAFKIARAFGTSSRKFFSTRIIQQFGGNVIIPILGSMPFLTRIHGANA